MKPWLSTLLIALFLDKNCIHSLRSSFLQTPSIWKHSVSLLDCVISEGVTVFNEVGIPIILQVFVFHPGGDQHITSVSKWEELTLLPFLDLLLEASVSVAYVSRFANETELSVISQLMQIRCQEGYWKGKMVSSVLQGHCLRLTAPHLTFSFPSYELIAQLALPKKSSALLKLNSSYPGESHWTESVTCCLCSPGLEMSISRRIDCAEECLRKVFDVTDESGKGRK